MRNGAAALTLQAKEQATNAGLKLPSDFLRAAENGGLRQSVLDEYIRI